MDSPAHTLGLPLRALPLFPLSLLAVAQAELVAEVRCMLVEEAHLRSETTYQLLRGVRTLLLLGPEALQLETPTHRGETLQSYQ